ncbi:hypothetical protein FOZ62_012466, partial [Perkinsus olseni]
RRCLRDLGSSTREVTPIDICSILTAFAYDAGEVELAETVGGGNGREFWRDESSEVGFVEGDTDGFGSLPYHPNMPTVLSLLHALLLVVVSARQDDRNSSPSLRAPQNGGVLCPLSPGAQHFGYIQVSQYNK